MATEHLKTDPKYKKQGLDLSVLKLKIYNWMAIEVAEKVDIHVKIDKIGMTTHEKMEKKSNELGDIINGFVKGSIVYVDKSQEAETKYTVPTTQRNNPSNDPEIMLHDESEQQEIVVSQEERNRGGITQNLVTHKWNLRLK